MSGLFPELGDEGKPKKNALFPELDAPATDAAPKSGLFPELHNLPNAKDIEQAALNATPGAPPQLERAAGAELAGTARSAAPILKLLSSVAPFAPAADIAGQLPGLANKIEPKNQNLGEKFLSGRIANSDISDLFSPTQADILKDAEQTGQVPYGKILASSLAEGFTAAIKPMIPTNPVEAATLKGAGEAIGLLQNEIPALGRSISDLIFKKRVIVPQENLPGVMKDAYEKWLDTYTKGGSQAEANKAALDTFEQSAGQARGEAVSAAQGKQGAPPADQTTLPSTNAPGGVPATELQIPGKLQRNAEVALDNIKKALGAGAEAPVETSGTVLPGQESPPETGLPAAGPKPGPIIEPTEPLPPSGVNYLTKEYPALAHAVTQLPGGVHEEVVKQAVVDATAKAIEQTIKGASPEQAQAAAIQHLHTSVADQVATSPELVSAPPKPKAIKLDEEGVPVRAPRAVVDTVDLGGGQSTKILHRDVLGEAEGLLQQAKQRNEALRNSREADNLPLIRWTKDLEKLGDFNKSTFPNWAWKKFFSTNPVHQTIDEVAHGKGMAESELIRKITDSIKSGKRLEPENLGHYYDEALRNLQYFAQEGVGSAAQQARAPYQAKDQNDLFNVPQENLTQRYQRLVSEGKSKGLNPVQAIKYAKERLSAPQPKQEAAPKPMQQELGQGVSFGHGEKDSQELFEAAADAYKNSKVENDVAYGSQEKFTQAVDEAIGGLRGHSGDLSRLRRRMEIYNEIKAKGFYDIVGKTARNAEELAELTAIARNPAVEILQWVFGKGDAIIAHHAFSLGLPSTIPIPDSMIDAVKRKSDELGADWIVAVHNHPSGDPTPSGAGGDMSLHNHLLKRLPKYKYHIVHDHEKFAKIDEYGGVTFNKYLTEKPKFTDDGLIKVSDPKQIASYANENFKNNKAMVVYMDNQNHIHGHEYVNPDSPHFSDMVTSRLRAFKVSSYAVVMSHDPDLLGKAYSFAENLPAGLLDLLMEKRGEYTSLRGTGMSWWKLEMKQRSPFGPPELRMMSMMQMLNHVGGLPEEQVNRMMRLSEPNPSYDPKMGEPGPNFYSVVEYAINVKMAPRSSGDQILGLLRNTPGVKQEEIDWMGLPEFLKDKPSVTKEELKNFIQQNNVQVQEVMKSGSVHDSGIQEKGNRFRAYVETDRGFSDKMFDTRKEAQDWIDLNNRDAGPLKFEKYTLPGAENYRELLLTLPNTEAEKLNARRKEIEALRHNATPAQKQEWVDLMNRLRPDNRDMEGIDKFRGFPEFKSSHFSERNVLTHVRFNDRTDAEGNKVLFLEEIQSDWHQRGREKGYKGMGGLEAKKAFDDYSNELAKKYDLNPNLNLSMFATLKKMDPAEVAKYDELQHAWLEKDGQNMVPDAPFKKTWHELALKRMLRYAAENGYDKIAWTTGEQQAERYDLSKRVDRINVIESNDGGKYELAIYPKGEGRLQTQIVSKQDLPGVVGKDLAKKIIDAAMEKPGMEQEFTGLDLKVGGEGMKGFYDQMIPSFLNKYTKKWGGRVGESEISAGDQLTHLPGPEGTFMQGKIEKQPTTKSVHSLDITPSMKESVMRGQALFEPKSPYEAKKVSEHLTESASEIRNLVAPEKAAPLAAAITREQLGKMARSYDMAEEALGKVHRYFETQSVANITDFIDKMEKGEAQPTKELEAMAKPLRELLDLKRSQIQALGTGKLNAFIENYFPHIWDQGEKSVSQAVQKAAKRPFEGGKSFLKKRSIEYFKDGIELGLTPVSWNPVDMALLKVREMDKYLMAHSTLQEFKKEGLTKFVSLGGDIPDGWQKINDKISTVMRPIANEEGKLQGLAITGHYYAQPDAARIINNYLSPGLQKSSVYQAYRGIGNALNQFQLGFSAFHLGFTSVDAIVSKTALAINQAALGHPIKALASLIQSPIAPIQNIIRGEKMIQAWRGKGAASIDRFLAEAMAAGGGRARMDQFYATNAVDQMKKFFKGGQFVRGLLKIPTAIMESSSKPILEYIVPRQKLGILADIMKMEFEHNPNMTHVQMRDLAQKAWNSVDNRMGQMVYDNIFWNRTFKDLLMGSVRSVGWNLGTVRELGGGLADIGKIGQGEKGRGANVSYRLAYLMALPFVVGMMGAIYQYLRTGKGPQELKDYYFPRTGGTDANGDVNRAALPSYMKDVYHYTTHPFQTILNKLHPSLAMLAQMYNNKDFFGVKIRNEDDPLMQQLISEVSYVAKQATPFGIRNLQRNLQSGDKGAIDILQPFIGITPAPYDVNQTKAEMIAHRIAAEKIPIGGRTQEQADKSQLLKDFTKRMKQNDPTAQRDMMLAFQQGKISAIQIKTALRNSRLTPIQRLVHSFGADETQRVYDAATPEEKQQLEIILRQKKARSRHGYAQPVPQ